MSTTWNDAKDADFTRMRLARTPVREMAVHFGTTAGAIYAHARVLKAFVMERRDWTREEVAELVRMDDENVAIREMGRRLDRTEQSVSWKLNDLGRAAKRMRYWKDDDARVRAMADAGETPEAIAGAIERSVESVRDRLCVLGYGETRRKWDGADVDRLRAAVDRGDDADVIAADLARDVGSVRAKAYAVGLRFSGPARTLTPGEVAGLRVALSRKGGMVDYAESLGVGVRWLRDRAREAGIEVQTRRRRALTEEAKAEIVAAARAGVPITVAVRELGRDARTLKGVADAAGVPFAKPFVAPKAPKVRIVKIRLSSAIAPREAATVRAGAAPTRETVVRRTAVVPTRISAKAAPRVAFVPVRRKAAERPPLDRAAMDAAVASFLAARTVTRETLDPVEETVRAIRRKGYAVVRDEGDFVVDGRTRLGDATGLVSFALARGIEVPASLRAA